MNLLVVVLFLVVLAAFALLRKRRSATSDALWPCYTKRPLTSVEQVLYHRLVSALPEHIVLAQVQVSRILGVKKGFKFNEWNNRINRLSYDFVVCSKDSTVLAAIELDDKTHQAAKRVAADQRKSKATADAGIRLIRWPTKSLPDRAEIEAAFTVRALAAVGIVQ